VLPYPKVSLLFCCPFHWSLEIPLFFCFFFFPTVAGALRAISLLGSPYERHVVGPNAFCFFERPVVCSLFIVQRPRIWLFFGTVEDHFFCPPHWAFLCPLDILFFYFLFNCCAWGRALDLSYPSFVFTHPLFVLTTPHFPTKKTHMDWGRFCARARHGVFRCVSPTSFFFLISGPIGPPRQAWESPGSCYVPPAGLLPLFWLWAAYISHLCFFRPLFFRAPPVIAVSFRILRVVRNSFPSLHFLFFFFFFERSFLALGPEDQPPSPFMCFIMG